MRSLLWPTFNFLVLVGLLFYFLREPAKKFISDRHNDIRGNLNYVRDLLRKSHEQYEEVSSKLKAVEAEQAALRNQALQEAESVKTKIHSHAREAATTLVMDARDAAGSRWQELRAELTAEMGLRVVSKAEELLKKRLTGADRERIRREFSARVGSIEGLHP